MTTASNFAFLQGSLLDDLYIHAREAERSALVAPRTACFYARFVLEQAVAWVYRHDRALREVKGPLMSRIRNRQFEQEFRPALLEKMKLIVRLGNKAVHEERRIPQERSFQLVKELHHVLYKILYLYSEQSPPNLTFDAAAVPSGQARHEDSAQFKALEKRLAAQAEELRRKDDALLVQEEALSHKDKEIEALHAQLARTDARERIAALQAQLAAEQEQRQALQLQNQELQAQQQAQDEAITERRAENQTRVDPRDYNEQETRRYLIDVLLEEAGWEVSDKAMVGKEVRVAQMPGTKSGRGYADYVLWSPKGHALAVVEAKRVDTPLGQAQAQASYYATALETDKGVRPTIYISDGYRLFEIDDYGGYTWDQEGGGYPKREVYGFRTQAQLEQLHYRRDQQKDPTQAQVDREIAGRSYQQDAIQAVASRFRNKKRRALLVMATGSGKTRTAIAATKLFQQCNWVDRVLFLADRNALLTQAKRNFKQHLPNATVEDITQSGGDGGQAQVVFSTYPTMMNRLEAECYRPADFDLIVIDEAHRSIFQKYKAIFEYFDGLLLGLTATPRDELDRNSYRTFDLAPEEGPTFAYELEAAVEDGYLVAPKLIEIETEFLRRGIRYNDLSEDDQRRFDQYRDEDERFLPDDIDQNAMYRWLFNKSTVDEILAIVMDRGRKIHDGDRIGKTIIFARNTAHASFILERFEHNYPQYGNGFAQLIHSGVSHAQSVLDNFAEPDKSPQIAISVDMLDTGVDVPEVVNLVFFRPVFSAIKFAQMVGRGTRLCPDLYGVDQDKNDFLCFDVFGNFAYFERDAAKDQKSRTRSLGQQLMEARLKLAMALGEDVQEAGKTASLGLDAAAYRAQLLDQECQRVQSMQRENFRVRKDWKWVMQYSDREAWESLSPTKIHQLCEVLGALPDALKPDPHHARRFDLTIYRTQLAQLEGNDDLPKRHAKLQEMAGSLLEKRAVPAIKAEESTLEAMQTESYWAQADLALLEELRHKLRDLPKFAEKRSRASFFVTDFSDQVTAKEVAEAQVLYQSGAALSQYKKRVEAYLDKHKDHITIAKLHMDKPLTEQDITSLEELLFDWGLDEIGSRQQLLQAYYERVQNNDDLAGLIRSIVGLDQRAVQEALAAFRGERQFNANQRHFLQLLERYLIKNGGIAPSELYEQPFTDRGDVDELFEDQDTDKIFSLVKRLNRPSQKVQGKGRQQGT